MSLAAECFAFCRAVDYNAARLFRFYSLVKLFMSDSRPASQNPASPVPRLISCLRARRTYLMIYQRYRQSTPKVDFAGLLDVMLDDLQDAVATLSRVLRLLDTSPVKAEANEKLFNQAQARLGTASKLAFMETGSSRAVAWYQEQLQAGDPPEIQAIWQALAEMEARHLAGIQALLGQAELTDDGAGDGPLLSSKSTRPPTKRPPGRGRRVKANPTRRKPGKR